MRFAAALLLFCPTGAIAAMLPPPGASSAPPLQQAVSSVDEAQDGRTIVARILLLNGVRDRSVDAPDRLDATLHAGGRDFAVSLARQSPPTPIGPGGWAAVDYVAPRPAEASGAAVLSLGTGAEGYAFALPQGPAARLAEAAVSAVPSRVDRPAGTQSAAVLGNLLTYRPVYAVSGSGTNSDVKVQLSFQYQPFGHAGEPSASWLDGFRLAYTQSIYWDVAHASQPFRDVSYEPEFFYLHRWPGGADGLRFSARGGFLHESNGKGGADSRGYQYLYVQPEVAWPLGPYTLSVGPRLVHYIFGRDNNPDIARYRGHQALALSIGRDDGLKLATLGRYNFASGKGSVDADLSYPLRGLIGRTPLYLVVQGFTGYGEDLLDYNRRQTRIRVGLGIVR